MSFVGYFLLNLCIYINTLKVATNSGNCLYNRNILKALLQIMSFYVFWLVSLDIIF